MCTSPLCYSPVELAGHYATTAGVLAGFGFAGLPLIVNRPDLKDKGVAERRKFEDVLITFVVALAALIVIAVLYAAMSSEEVIGGRVGIEEVAAGLAFVGAILALLFGITVLVEVAEFWEVAIWARLVTGVFVPLVAQPLLGIAVSDAHTLNTGSNRESGLTYASLGGLCAVAVAAAIGWGLSPRGSGGVYRHWVAITALALTSLAVFIFAATSFTAPETGMPDSVGYAVIAGDSVLLVIFVVFVAQTRTPRPALSEPEAGPHLQGDRLAGPADEGGP
jgi:uncharacterized membrane protein